MRIAFLAYNDFEELDLVGPWELAGELVANGSIERAFIVAETKDSIKARHGMQILPHYNFVSCPQFDVLLVPGGPGRKLAAGNPTLINFVRQRSESCGWILSVCTGAFILERAGILEGKKACTHWGAIKELRSLGVDVVEERWVRDGNIWCSSGVSAGMDMILAFFSEALGEGAAAEAQFFAEYYPSGARYGNTAKNPNAPNYLKRNE